MAGDVFACRQFSEMKVAGEQYPGIDPGQRRGEAVGWREGPVSLPVSECECDTVSVEFLDPESESDQGGAAVFGEFLMVEQVGDRELEGQSESGLEQRSAFEIDQDRAIRDQNFDGHQCRAAAASTAGGSSTRRFSSWTEIPRSSAALASDTAPSTRARKHRRSKRRSFSPFLA